MYYNLIIKQFVKNAICSIHKVFQMHLAQFTDHVIHRTVLHF